MQAEMEVNVVSNHTTGEMRLQVTVPEQVAILLTPDMAKSLIAILTRGIEYIEANEQLVEAPDNVVMLGNRTKH